MEGSAIFYLVICIYRNVMRSVSSYTACARTIVRREARGEVVIRFADNAPNTLIQYTNRTSKIADILMRVIPVHRFLPEALADILRKAPLTEHKVAFAWRSSVGPAIDRGTTVALRNGVLHVTVKEEAWGREVERSKGLIRARLDSLLGAGVVRAIEVGRAAL